MKFLISTWISLTFLFGQKSYQPPIGDLSPLLSSPASYSLLMPADSAALNPFHAAINRVSGEQLSVSYHNYIFDTHSAAAAYGFSLDSTSLVFGLASLRSEDFERRLVDGSKQGTYSNASTEVYALAARQLTADFRAGALASFTIDELDTYTASYLRFSLSAVYRALPRLFLHAVLSDLTFQSVKFRQREEDIEATLNFGAEYTLQKAPIALFASSVKGDVVFGSRVRFSHLFDLTLSYNNDLADSVKKEGEREFFNGFAAAARLRRGNQQFMLGLRSLGVLGTQFSLGFSQTLD